VSAPAPAAALLQHAEACLLAAQHLGDMLCCLSLVGAAAGPARPGNGLSWQAESGAVRRGAGRCLPVALQGAEVADPHPARPALLVAGPPADLARDHQLRERVAAHAGGAQLVQQHALAALRLRQSVQSSPGPRSPPRRRRRQQVGGAACKQALPHRALLQPTLAVLLLLHWLRAAIGQARGNSAHNRACNAVGRRREEEQPERTLPATPST